MPKTSTVTPQYLSEKDAAKWLGICPRTLWGLRASNRIPFAKFGRSVRYDIDDLRVYAAANKKGAANE